MFQIPHRNELLNELHQIVYTPQVVYIKYVQLFVCQLYLNQMVRKKKNPPLVEFSGSTKKEYSQLSLYRLLKYFFIFQLYSCMRPDFLHILQPEQHFTTDCIQKQA